MRISIISFSQAGYRLSETLYRGLKERAYEASVYTKSKYTENMPDQSRRKESGDGGNVPTEVRYAEGSVVEWTKRRFCDSDAIVYVGACGIAVRSIAPFVKSKKEDPAVVVVDERGRFSISLLSGHLGGANGLAEEIAKIICACPVVTTATDLNDRFAVDIFAKRNGCHISDMGMAKEISAAVLAGRQVGFFSAFSWNGEIPEELKLCTGAEEENPELGICVAAGYRERPFRNTLYLIPKVITVGVGCKKGASKEAVESVIRKVCGELSIPPEAIEQAASIDLKKEEPGILEYCRERNIPLITYTSDELKEAEGAYTESEFVKRITGVGNVCERAALLGSGKEGGLIQRKYAQDGVTAALAIKKWSVDFE